MFTDHQNFFGFDDRYGPVVISFRREKIDDKTSVYHYRIIVRTCEVRFYCLLYQERKNLRLKARTSLLFHEIAMDHIADEAVETC